MPTFGTITRPVRNHPNHPIHINDPDGFMTEPPGDLWWIGMHDEWDAAIPPAVTRATAIIVNPLVRMPWIVTTPDGTQLAPGDPGYPVWLTDPMLLNGSSGGGNLGWFPMLQRLDRFDLFARWVRDALHHGAGLLTFRPGSDGPLAGTLRRLPIGALVADAENRMRVRLGDQEYPIDPQTGTYIVQGDAWRILPLRHSIPGGVFGRHRAQLQLANRIGGYATESLDSAVPSGVLSTDQPINPTQASDIRTEWVTTQQRRTIAVLGNGAKYQQVLMSPVEAELVEMARLSNEQVAHMFELAAWHLDAGTNSLTYSNARENRQELVDGTLASWSARIEETIGSLLPWGTTMRIDFTQYTTPTTPEAPRGPSDPA